MNSSKTEIDKWFFESSLADNKLAIPEAWEPIFDADRQLIHSRIGPYWKLFLRYEGFVKRFYHRVYPLPVENWYISRKIELYDGFCSITVTLNIRFQTTLKYALSNIDILSNLNGHIKVTYEDLLINLIDKELLNLSDGAWVQEGVTPIEQRISLAISEMLILQNIQSQAHCTVKPLFEEFPDVQLPQEHVYLCVLKKCFEFNDAKREILFYQEQQLEQQKLEHKQRQLAQLDHDAELERLQQAQEALNKKRLLEEKEQQLLELFAVEQRLHAGQVKQENSLKEITLEAELQEQQKHKARLRLAEQQTQMEILEHEAQLKEQELAAEIAKHENQQAKWRASNYTTHAEQIAFEQHQKQLEFDVELENQKRHEQQQLDMQKESFDKKKDADVYLRREIELLALEKQCLELQFAIKDAKRQEDANIKPVPEAYSVP
jgi:hypothetical protein